MRSLAGIEGLEHLEDLVLAKEDGQLRSLWPLPLLHNLSTLDVSGHVVPCADLDRLYVDPQVTSDCVVTGRLPLPERGADLLLSPDEQTLYATLPSRQELLAIDTATLQIVRTWPLEDRPDQLSLSYDSSRVLVTFDGIPRALSVSLTDPDDLVWIELGLVVRAIAEVQPGIHIVASQEGLEIVQAGTPTPVEVGSQDTRFHGLAVAGNDVIVSGSGGVFRFEWTGTDLVQRATSTTFDT